MGKQQKRRDRYDASGFEENQYEPGSCGRVLKNLRGITIKREMDLCEGREQIRALEELATLYDKDHRFTAADMCRIHKVWLGRIYSWAGKYRQVNATKDDFPFAAAAQIPKLMAAFEEGPLRQFTPCRPAATDALAMALAEVHVELVFDPPVQGRQWARGQTLGRAYGVTSRLAGSVLRQTVWTETTAVLCCGSSWA